LSLQAAVGDLVTVGTVLCNVELGDNDLIASVYVSPADARKIGPHALVQLSPADVRREEFGYMLGRVSHVSRFPTTEHEMMYLLENESLVKLLSSHGPPLGIEVELLKDRSTFSGFKWTTAASPPVAITSGTICTAQIVVGERRPIDMLIPHVRETLGI
jgi:HlyD family secretion protein